MNDKHPHKVERTVRSEMFLSQERREGLRAVAKFLRENITQDIFDMTHFRQGRAKSGELYKEWFDAPESCGTVGCLLGWFPLSDVPMFEAQREDYEGGCLLCFVDYSERTLALLQPVWSFLFSPEWRHYDNTPEGGAARLLVVANWQGSIREWELGPYKECDRLMFGDNPHLPRDSALKYYRNLIHPYLQEAA